MSYLARQISDKFQNPIEAKENTDFLIDEGEKCDIGEQFWFDGVGMFEVVGVTE